MDRESLLENIGSRRFDLIVVGAGINGAGIARDAAMRGLSVLLLDKGDISSGTTQWATRLIHGGLRYLEHYEFALVRESLRDREALLHVAPHLVKPLGFLVPVYDRERARASHDPSRHDALRHALLRQEHGKPQDVQPEEDSGARAGAQPGGAQGCRLSTTTPRSNTLRGSPWRTPSPPRTTAQPL